jgi:predicted nucleic acid-binding protein
VKQPLILDSGALIALSRRSRDAWDLLDRAQRTGMDVLVPAGTLAETLRGDNASDALINRLLNRPLTRVTVHDEERARAAGQLLARAATDDVVDALVVAEALRHDGAMIITSDPDDIADLAADSVSVVVIRV